MPTPAVLAHGVEQRESYVVMAHVPGERLDDLSPERRLTVLPGLGALLRRVHEIRPPQELPALAATAGCAEYRAHGGPAAELITERLSGLAIGRPGFCHGDLVDGNVLVQGGTDRGPVAICGIVDWERAAVSDPLRDLALATFHASRKDPGAGSVLLDGYGLPSTELDRLATFELLHAAQLWTWLTVTGDLEGRRRVQDEIQCRL